MSSITWVDDVPMPAMSEDDYFDQMNVEEEDEWDWENDFNYVGSRCHY